MKKYFLKASILFPSAPSQEKVQTELKRRARAIKLLNNLYKFSQIHVSAELINILWVESVHIEQDLQFVPEPDYDDRSEDGDEAEGDQGEDAKDVQGL